jgi:hypothetical protein
MIPKKAFKGIGGWMDNVGNGDEDYCFKCESSKIVWKFGMPLTGVRDRRVS